LFRKLGCHKQTSIGPGSLNSSIRYSKSVSLNMKKVPSNSLKLQKKAETINPEIIDDIFNENLAVDISIQPLVPN
jgi:hypothetical protein